MIGVDDSAHAEMMNFDLAFSPQNLTQGQREFFAAHTYQRVDRPASGFVHTDWQELPQRPAGGEAR